MDVRVVDPLVGRTLDGRYVVRARIARGGMATVYLGHDERLARDVALKVMHPGLGDDPDFLRRFTQEARSAARLNHPGIVQVYDQGEHDGVAYLAMEHVPGRTLRALMDERGPLSAREAFDLLEPVLDALAVAHAAGIVHRDVKPENVLLTADGRTKVADFGLARAVDSVTTSQTGLLIGTVAYLAPEQVERGRADARSDVYAAGVLLFELVTGTKPFAGETAVQIAFQHVTSSVPAPSERAPDVPAAVDDVVAAAANRDPAARPADARELLMLVRETRHRMSAVDLDRRAPWPAGGGPRAAGATSDPAPAAGPGHDGTVRLQLEDRDTHVGAPPHGPRGRRHDGGRRGRRGGRGRRGRRGRFVLLGVLLLAALLGVGGWYLGAGPGAYTTVPPVEGRTQAEAQQVLSAAGLGADVRSAFSETVPSGRVVSADPGQGQRVRKRVDVALVVSKGQQRFLVPDVVGSTRDAARAAVAARSLVVGTTTERYDEQVPAGQVVAQSPPSGTRAVRGTAVGLVVSKGRRPVPVRSYVGTDGDAAAAALQAAGLHPVVTQDYSDRYPAGQVAAQSPSRGTLHRGGTVSLVVSKGPQLVTVPRVVGQQADDAERTLRAAGFDVRVRKILGGYFRTVRQQDPGPGEQAPRGSTIVLTVV